VLRLLLVVALALGAGCARDVVSRCPSGPDEATGTIVLVLTRPSPDAYVAVNGVLVVDGAHTSKVTITGVSTGYADLAIALGPAEKQLRVWVDASRPTVVPLGSPGGSALDSVKSMVMSLAALAIYTAIR